MIKAFLRWSWPLAIVIGILTLGLAFDRAINGSPETQDTCAQLYGSGRDCDINASVALDDTRVSQNLARIGLGLLALGIFGGYLNRKRPEKPKSKPPEKPDTSVELCKAKNMFEDGLIDEEEYKAWKKKIIGLC